MKNENRSAALGQSLRCLFKSENISWEIFSGVKKDIEAKQMEDTVALSIHSEQNYVDIWPNAVNVCLWFLYLGTHFIFLQQKHFKFPNIF